MSDPYFAPPVSSAAPEVTPVPVEDPADADGFDRERVLRLLDRLETDIGVVEAAMEHAESGDQAAFAAAVAPLEPQLTD
jgi:hypothetical protein